MKFWKKQVLFTVAAISVILGFGRYYIVRNNFIHSMSAIAMQKANQYLLEKYMLESKVVRNIQSGKEVTDETLLDFVRFPREYMGQGSEYVALYTEDYRQIYSDIDIEWLGPDVLRDLFQSQRERDDGGASSDYTYCLLRDKPYLLFASVWELHYRTVYLVNAYDVTVVFEERDRQSRAILLADVVILAVSSLVISLFSIFLTAPIKKLNRASRKIADGEFQERVRIGSRDEIGELAESFNRMADQVEERISDLNTLIKQKDDFLNGFTHELKTPMTAIMGYADLLRLKNCDEEISRKALNYIYSDSKRLESLAFKLMTLMSLSEEEMKLEDLDVQKLIRRVMKAEAELLKNAKIEAAAQPYMVRGDGELLESVLRNLIENADKAEPRDHKIRIRGEILRGGRYRISVTDRGRGIPREHLDRVTEDFYMVDKSRSRAGGGSGIGLSLVKKILDFHGSVLSIQSVENVGTTVSFELAGERIVSGTKTRPRSGEEPSAEARFHSGEGFGAEGEKDA